MSSNTAPQFDIDAELKRMEQEDTAVRSAVAAANGESNSNYTWTTSPLKAAAGTATDGDAFSSTLQNENPLLSPDQFKDRWANRRKMAWVGLLAILGVTLLLFFGLEESKMKLLLDSGVITWFYGSMTAIVGAYMGFTTWHDMSGKK